MRNARQPGDGSPSHGRHPVLPSDHRIRRGRAACVACAQPEPECLCGALGQVCERGVLVQSDPLWRALPAASLERICRTFPCRTESSGEGQCAAVPSGYEHPPRRACSMPRATGRTIALLPSGGGMIGHRASDEIFALTRYITVILHGRRFACIDGWLWYRGTGSQMHRAL